MFSDSSAVLASNSSHPSGCSGTFRLKVVGDLGRENGYSEVTFYLSFFTVNIMTKWSALFPFSGCVNHLPRSACKMRLFWSEEFPPPKFRPGTMTVSMFKRFVQPGRLALITFGPCTGKMSLACFFYFLKTRIARISFFQR